MFKNFSLCSFSVSQSYVEETAQADVEQRQVQPISQQSALNPVFAVGSYVQVVKGAYCGMYSTILDKSYSDEWEINCFLEKSNYRGKYWVLKPHDTGSREEEGLILVTGFPDEKERFTFEDIK